MKYFKVRLISFLYNDFKSIVFFGLQLAASIDTILFCIPIMKKYLKGTTLLTIIVSQNPSRIYLVLTIERGHQCTTIQTCMFLKVGKHDLLTVQRSNILVTCNFIFHQCFIPSEADSRSLLFYYLL